MKNKRRCIFVDDVTWKAIVKAAEAEGRPAASWIRQAIAAALNEP